MTYSTACTPDEEHNFQSNEESLPDCVLFFDDSHWISVKGGKCERPKIV